MKKILELLAKWMVFGLGIVIVLWISYLAIKARQTTNPNLTEPSPTGALYVNTNETLSSAKRNSLVDKNNRIICTKSASWEWNGVDSSSKVITFTASDCWWVLPDSTYIWFASGISICGIATNPQISSVPATLTLWMYLHYCWNYTVSIVYIKK